MKLNIEKQEDGTLSAKGIVTLKEAMAITGLTARTLYKKCEKREIRFVWVSSTKCFIRKDLEKIAPKD